MKTPAGCMAWGLILVASNASAQVCGPANHAPVPTCRAFFEQAVGDDCRWHLASRDLEPDFRDPDGDALVCRADPAEGDGLQIRPLNVWCDDACGAPGGRCEPLVVPRDRTGPRIAVGRPRHTIHLADGPIDTWWFVHDICQITWTDNCTPVPGLRHGIVGITSSDPGEPVQGQPGLLSSAQGILADWYRFTLNLDQHRIGPRTYEITYAVVDADDNVSRAPCIVRVVGPDEPACDDRLHNGDETGVDCGGPDCPACPRGEVCHTDDDCDTGFCAAGRCADCAAPTPRFADRDGDGFGDAEDTVVACGVPAGYVEIDGDCDDDDEAVNPAAAEACNEVDDDCDGQMDDGFDAGAVCAAGVGACRRAGTRACNDLGDGTTCDAEPGRPAAERCGNGADDDCDGITDEGFDAGDACAVGVGACRRDGRKVCDAAGAGTVCDAQAGAAAAERCNGADDDCDGRIDEGDPEGGGACQTDRPGRCAPGTQVCRDGALACDADAAPIAERCNGADDDCDGAIDDGNPDGGAACQTGQPGRCAPGTEVCRDGAVACVRDADPMVEACNGADDDCDGAIDDGNPGGGAACQTGRPGRCAPGTEMCRGGAVACVGAADAVAEQCNGIDDDCDGMVDEGNPGGGAQCQTGQAGRCAPGRLLCQGGAVVCDRTDGPIAESCNGADDDCDGVVDDGFGVGDACQVGLGACQRAATLVCNAAGDGTRCNASPGAPTAERCGNGVDDDCDGAVDEGFDNGDACQVGQGTCRRVGLRVCNAARDATVCDAVAGSPTAESCNALDDDCDGTVDEQNPGGGVACQTGQPGRCSAGIRNCHDGALLCDRTNGPIGESCNGADDDCDAATDEQNAGGGAACQSGQPGRCAAGTVRCLDATLSCVRDADPVAEQCNGVDDDCDGTIDQGNPQGGAACVTGRPGRCGPGNVKCVDASLTCVGTSGAIAETCNGVDDDCDGIVDEGNPQGGGACVTGQAGRCGAGTQLCQGGALVCNRTNGPVAETCNGVDDDCDGVIDQSNPQGGGACVTGQSGRCSAGTQLCQGGALVCNRTNGPVAETCNGVDDDCDGVIDQSNPQGGGACVTGQAGRCSAGTQLCQGGALVCNRTNGPVAETCNGVDDDCDGVIDQSNPQGGGACVTGQPGRCSAGTQACQGGALVCNRNNEPIAESCNGADDNCDGTVDEGNPGGGAACGSFPACQGGSTQCSGGSLQCVAFNQPSGSACGDQTSNICTSPDSCDGAGNCRPNNVADGTVCQFSGIVCFCSSGVCGSCRLIGCFPAGTEVQTPQGPRPIEKLVRGDPVIGHDPMSGATLQDRVKLVERRPATDIMTLELTDGSTLRATTEHPFWVIGSGWVRAKELLTGDAIRTLDGDITVKRLSAPAPGAKPEYVYNVGVEGSAGYFVGGGKLLVSPCDLMIHNIGEVPSARVAPPAGIATRMLDALSRLAPRWSDVVTRAKAQAAAAASRKAALATAPLPPLLVVESKNPGLSLVTGLEGTTPKITPLPCFPLKPWAQKVAERDGTLLVLDVTDRSVLLISTDVLRGIARGEVSCRKGDVRATRVHLASGDLPVLSRLDGDLLYVPYFEDNHVDIYQLRPGPDLDFVDSVRLPGSASLGLTDVAVFEGHLLVTAARWVCKHLRCDPRFGKPGLFAVDLVAGDGPAPKEIEPADTDPSGLYRHPGTGHLYLLNAGDVVDGYASVQRVLAPDQLGPEIILPGNARIDRAYTLDGRLFAMLSMSGDHVIVMDALTDRVVSIQRFDGRWFQPQPLDVLAMPDRTGADLRELLPDPRAPDRFFLIDAKGEQLIHLALMPGTGQLVALGTAYIGHGNARRIPFFAQWLGEPDTRAKRP